MLNVVSRTFPTAAQAQCAVLDLLGAGIEPNAIVIKSREGESTPILKGNYSYQGFVTGAVLGSVAGGVLGVMFGVQSYFYRWPGMWIFGVLPWLIAGVVVGGGAGSGLGLLLGITKPQPQGTEFEVEGPVSLNVSVDFLKADRANEILHRYGYNESA